MQVTLPYNIYLLLERKLGKEEAQTVGKAIEESLSVIKERAEEIALQKKVEIKEELSKELASKGDIALLKKDMEAVEARLNSRIDKLEIKLNFLIILMIIALTLMNPVAADIIRSWIK